MGDGSAYSYIALKEAINSKKVAFEDFHIPKSLIDTVLDVGNLYRNVKIT